MATPFKNSFRPTVESLEDRMMPSVTWHQGPVLQHARSENIYLGSDWKYNASLNQTARKLEVFGATLVNSPYIDAMTRAGYGVGRGMAYQGLFEDFSINKAAWLTDQQIRNCVQYGIMHGAAQPTTTYMASMYVVYVEPGVKIVHGNETSVSNFDGYHSYFIGHDASGRNTYIPYAVVAYPGGPNANWYNQGYSSAFNCLTDVASHEMAETITDPIPGTGWHDNSLRGEIGDITNNYHQFMNGYYVQLVSNQQDHFMPVNNSTLYYAGSSGLLYSLDLGAHWYRM